MPRVVRVNPQLSAFRHVFLRPPEEDVTEAQRGLRLMFMDRPEWFHEQMSKLERDHEASYDRRKKVADVARAERRGAAGAGVSTAGVGSATEAEDAGTAAALALIERLLLETK